jgi:hypothetical protein
MDELIFAGNKYISSKRASKLTGYTTDYIGQMCREDKINCRLVGRNWYVNDIAIREQKKSFKKEQLNINKKAIEYQKLDLEPMYYSDDVRANNPKVNKVVLKNIEEYKEDIVEQKKENLIPILSMIESPIVDLRNTKKEREIIKRPTREITKRRTILPQKSHIKLPMARLTALLLLLVAFLFVASSFTLEKTIYYTSSDKSLDTEYQIANISKLFSF